MYGRKAKQPGDLIIQPQDQMTNEERMTYRINQEITRISQIREQARDFISKAQERQKRNYDQAHKETLPLKLGDKVLLYRNVVESSWSAKLEPKWEGPYLIASIKGTTYQLKRLTGTILPFRVHRNRLKKYHDAETHE